MIRVTTQMCPYYPPPINGLLSCSQSGSSDMCNVQCNDQYDFAATPAQLYACMGGMWMLFPWDMHMPWPDCTVEYEPGAAKKGMEWQYFTGDCSDPQTQNQAKVKSIHMPPMQAY